MNQGSEFGHNALSAVPSYEMGLAVGMAFFLCVLGATLWTRYF